MSGFEGHECRSVLFEEAGVRRREVRAWVEKIVGVLEGVGERWWTPCDMERVEEASCVANICKYSINLLNRYPSAEY
jgi:hypothetical protein